MEKVVPSSCPPADVLVSDRKHLQLLWVVPAPHLFFKAKSDSAVNLPDALTQPSSDAGEDFPLSFFHFLGGEFTADLLSVSLKGDP